MSSISAASARASARVASRCSRTASPIWSPTVCRGESDVIGSWKIIEIRPPRISRMAAPAGSRAAMSTPRASSGSARKRISPPLIRATAGRIPITDWEITDLPDPDSPTSATVFPCGTRNDTPSTARSAPWPCRLKSTRRSETSRTLPLMLRPCIDEPRLMPETSRTLPFMPGARSSALPPPARALRGSRGWSDRARSRGATRRSTPGRPAR